MLLDSTRASAPSQTSEEGRAFLQLRISGFGLMIGGLSAAFLAMRLVGAAAADDEHLRSEVLHPTLWLHALAVALKLAMFVGLRRGSRSVSALNTIEASVLLASSTAYIAMGAFVPLVLRPDLMVVLILAYVFLGRAIYVPSTWRRTLALGVVIGVVLLAMIAHHHKYGDPLFAETIERALGHRMDPSEVSVMVAAGAFAWWSATIFLAASASAVIYGLRREVTAAKQLGQYVLLQKLGAGGMGEVYEARHVLLRRPTAVKLLHPERAGEGNIARFEREVRATARLTHPNTVTIFDFGRSPSGTFYYAMELLEGGSVGEVVELDGPQPPERVAHVMHQVADALSEAHGIGLVHRDIKPSNVMLTVRGGVPDVAKVVDFGLVKERGAEPGVNLTGDNAIVGTPLYLAPEAIRQRDSNDPRSDLYALGALGYYMLTGEHVFAGETTIELLSKHLMEAPEPPSKRLGAAVPADLEALILELLAKAPSDRPTTAQAVMARLEVLACFGGWTRERARHWWNDLGPELAGSRRHPTAAHAKTVRVDLAHRSPTVAEPAT